MQTELKTEVVLCPSCREEVPKTLYCLNCGFPLYKENAESTVEEGAEDIATGADSEDLEIEGQEHLVEDGSIKILEEDSTQIMEVQSPTEDNLNTTIEPESSDFITESPEDDTFEEKQDTMTEEIIESEVSFDEEEGRVENEDDASEESSQIIESFEALDETVQNMDHDFEPDPIIIEVMDNFVKNISLKVRLVELLRNGEVNEETFNRLFESYTARGKRLMNSRNEMIERIRFDFEAMEKALSEASVGLEELEIKKAIGDVSEEEFNAKSPGFQWDINKYKDEAMRKKGELAYLKDLTRVISAEEIAQLRETAEICLSCVDEIVESGVITMEPSARIKLSLEEILSYLEGTN